SWATGHKYRTADAPHGKYVVTVASYHNPARPSVLALLYDYAVDPYNAGRVSKVMACLAGIALAGALVRRKAAVGHALLTFGPFFLFALFMLNPTQMGRLSLGYMPLFALL